MHHKSAYSWRGALRSFPGDESDGGLRDLGALVPSMHTFRRYTRTCLDHEHMCSSRWAAHTLRVPIAKITSIRGARVNERFTMTEQGWMVYTGLVGVRTVGLGSASCRVPRDGAVERSCME